MKSPRRMCLEWRLRQLGVFSKEEFSNLLQVWAKLPGGLWGSPESGEQSLYYHMKDPDSGLVYKYKISNDAGNLSGELRLPAQKGGGSVAVLVRRQVTGAGWVRVQSIRLSANVHGDRPGQALYVIADWTSGTGLALTVNEHSTQARDRLYRALKPRYGWSARAATVRELILMYFAYALPQLVVDRSRLINIGSA